MHAHVSLLRFGITQNRQNRLHDQLARVRISPSRRACSPVVQVAVQRVSGAQAARAAQAATSGTTWTSLEIVARGATVSAPVSKLESMAARSVSSGRSALDCRFALALRWQVVVPHNVLGTGTVKIEVELPMKLSPASAAEGASAGTTASEPSEAVTVQWYVPSAESVHCARLSLAQHLLGRDSHTPSRTTTTPFSPTLQRSPIAALAALLPQACE